MGTSRPSFSSRIRALSMYRTAGLAPSVRKMSCKQSASQSMLGEVSCYLLVAVRTGLIAGTNRLKSDQCQCWMAAQMVESGGSADAQTQDRGAYVCRGRVAITARDELCYFLADPLCASRIAVCAHTSRQVAKHLLGTGYCIPRE